MNGTEDFRAKLGSRLVFWSTLALIVLGAVIVIGAAVAEAKGHAGAVMSAAQLLVSALLPLFGTWVGTILAFYYTKENYESASRGTLDLVRSVTERLRSVSVGDKMMPRSQIVVEIVPPGRNLGDLAISAIESRFNTIGANGQRISRLLILDNAGACIAILHRAVFTEMLTLGLRDTPPLNPATDALARSLAKPYLSPAGGTYDDFIRKTIAFVAQDRTVADAKAAMEQVRGCQDVIITTTGDAAEPVLGWLSNVDIGRLSQV